MVASPSDASKICSVFALRSSRIVATALRDPWFILLAVASKTLGPGVTARMAKVAANDSQRMVFIIKRIKLPKMITPLQHDLSVQPLVLKNGVLLAVEAHSTLIFGHHLPLQHGTIPLPASLLQDVPKLLTDALPAVPSTDDKIFEVDHPPLPGRVHETVEGHTGNFSVPFGEDRMEKTVLKVLSQLFYGGGEVICFS